MLDENTKQFDDIVRLIEQRQSLAVRTVNQIKTFLNWHLGAYISSEIKSGAWGDGTVRKLVDYIHRKAPTLKGYSRPVIYHIVSFYDTYSSTHFLSLVESLHLCEPMLPTFMDEKVSAVPRQLISENGQGSEKVSAVPRQMDALKDNLVIRHLSSLPSNVQSMPYLLSAISWTNHVEILNHCDSDTERLFYILYSAKERYSQRELRRAFLDDAYTRVLGNRSFQSIGFKDIYPLAGHEFKDKVFVDFLNLPQRYTHKQLQDGLADHLRETVLELGKDFLFVGKEYPVEVGGETFHIDLLFFHRALRCLIAIELKRTRFHPRDMGQLEFYLEALDRDVKREEENPSIGILLCPDVNGDVVHYAMNRSMSPTMIAQYKEHLIPKDVLQLSLTDFVDFLRNGKGSHK